jgi:hypothetical protein
MRGPKRPKLKKRRVEYHSGSEEEEEQVKKMTKQDLKDLDIDMNDEGGISSNDDDDFNEDELEERKEKKQVEDNSEELEAQRTVKMASIISKILDTKADEKVSKKKVNLISNMK